MRNNIHIPWEITVDIFSKLPVKSLCRFKCLSKLFLSLINNPQFMKTHLSQSQTKSQKLLHILGPKFYSLDLESIPSSALPHKFVALNIDFPVRTCIPMYGSCNGLLFLSIGHSPDDESYGMCCVYNPSTRELKSVPECNLVAAGDECLLFQGFGYDDSTDDYKYVMITYFRREIFVYSLRTNNWKMLPDKFIGYKRPYFVLSKFGDFLNGSIHWAAFSLHILEYVIVAFELVDERFKILPIPVPTSHVTAKGYVLFTGNEVLGACIFTVFRLNDTDNFGRQPQLWVMKEYGVKESWSRIFLPNPPPPSTKLYRSSQPYLSTRSFEYEYPLCLCRIGDSDSILMVSHLKESMDRYTKHGAKCRHVKVVSVELLACNITDGTCQKLEIVAYKPTNIWWKPLEVCVESLVSPFKF
ncbi:F-box family protein [Melia azedarach]|uniref:F-box family protein n=1 Tax=Melia azedarach TaxID=155640 RepID=A0ACC1XF43_MELAZ|nr:F-box family protein [Melia azedarach]